jgi:CheY-like chemotaxis protein
VVIEDNVDANDSLKMVLEVLGHEVFPAFDGKAGVALVREKQPDIVLCDIGLPGQDGYQVIASLKKTMSPMPIMIALTGYGQAEDRVRALAAGFDHHLVKPVDIEALLRLIAGRGASPG